jgi:hypothetical protein
MFKHLQFVARGSIVCVCAVDPSQTRDHELQFPKCNSFTANSAGLQTAANGMARSTPRKRIREIDPIIIHEMYPTIPEE